MNRHPLRPVTKEDIARFKEDGAICIREVFDQRMGRAHECCGRAVLAESGKARPRSDQERRSGPFPHERVHVALGPGLPRFCAALAAAELGATLLEADKVSLFYDQAFIKEPGTREVTQWHQDMPFWPALGNDIISLWVALTPVTLEGSGVEYVAGSHKWGKFYQAQTPDKDSKFTDAALEPCPNFSELKGDPKYRFHLVGLPTGRCHLSSSADHSWRRRQPADQPPRGDLGALRRQAMRAGTRARM